MNTFARTVDLLHRAMDVSSVRSQVIANNIANADVPNFKRSNVNFESELKRVLDSENKRPAIELTLTHENHIPGHKARDYRDVQIRRVVDYASAYNNNGNNVDPEQEMMLRTQNQMAYTLYAQAAAFEFRQVNQVLRG
ncbi:MAG: flagellar basal body rod protein FlgB [Treponema sp.]|nr:flagellar basal body rod protein FlgB [Treponema sp.]MCL2251001.1 flagellar basal body rod protein FlgB [Treponema sp.]